MPFSYVLQTKISRLEIATFRGLPHDGVHGSDSLSTASGNRIMSLIVSEIAQIDVSLYNVFVNRVSLPS